MDYHFLENMDLRPVQLQASCPFEAVGMALGSGSMPLEVVVATYTSEPSATTLRSAWKARNAGRAAPLLFVVLYDDKAALCGPAGEDAPVRSSLDPGQVERICREALEQSDRHAALRMLRDSLPAVESELGGIRNEGFLATHELRVGAPQRSDWTSAGDKAKRLLGKDGEQLLGSLGYHIEPCDRVTSILRSHDKKLALAVLLNPAESPDMQSDRFPEMSPISYALTIADRENLKYVIICHGPKIRLYPTGKGVGVGQRGRAETYIECHTGLLRDTEAAHLWLLFSADALIEGGSLEDLLAESQRFAGSLAENLRDRIYEYVVPNLSLAIAEAQGLKKPTAQQLSDTYEMAMVVLFRLLFIAYAEDKDLLPYKWNGLYQKRSLKAKASEILELYHKEGGFDKSDSHWQEVLRLFKAVENGNKEWGVPEYDGDLFSTDPEVSPLGERISKLSIPNTKFGPVLRDLLLIKSQEGMGPVDFRSLGVREFGTIYEGLLESELSVAETNLGTDKNGLYCPTDKKKEIVVEKGEIYLHNRSGARKSSGTYFTKSFAVEHLLDKALEPALKDHFERISKLDDETAGDQFFDFRAADIAMGSGHFLVAAIDRIEIAFNNYLATRPLKKVKLELSGLRISALNALGSLADQHEIEDTQLLRRLIARRCIYGVDINPVAVQLARLAIWIHTFVPGLPLSFLDHNLVCGNSLVGIGQLSEIEEYARKQDLPLFPIDARILLGEATEPLQRLARVADVTVAEVKKSRKALEEANRAVAPAKALCDVITSCRMEGTNLPISLDDWDNLKKMLANSTHHKKALSSLQHLSPLHFPIIFPEVFLRDRSGFDVILGNPPWEEATVEEDAFWSRNFPGIRSLPQREQEKLKAIYKKERPDLQKLYEGDLARSELMRKALLSGEYPGMGTGDPDTYKAFCWRFWKLSNSNGGRIGVVLPRSAMYAKGSTKFRFIIFRNGDNIDITALLNTAGWVFDDAEHRYTIVLFALQIYNPEDKNVSLRGPYFSKQKYKEGILKTPATFSGEEIISWTDTASLPLLPTEESVFVFEQLRKSPRLDLNNGKSWRARPYSELHATNDKKLMDLKSKECPKGFWPVYKGESFDIWSPDTGKYYAWADPKKVIPALQEKRKRGGRNRRSAFSEFPAEWIKNKNTLPCHFPRIAFRDITNRTNQRTIITNLLPPNIFITNKGPYLLWPRGDEVDQAFLLGILSSIPLDWYARRFVETSVNFFIFNPFPVPRPEEKNIFRKRAINIAGRLAGLDERFRDWANKVGVEYGPLADDEKDDYIQELDAVVAHLYGLNQKQLIHIFETFHEGWDYESRLKATLKHYQEWKKKL